MPTRRTELDHVGAYNFKVEIGGVAAGYFKGVDGLNAERKVSFQDGDDYFVKTGGKLKTLRLSEGLLASNALRKWWESSQGGKQDTRSITIKLLDNTGRPVTTWMAHACWPKQWRTDAAGDRQVKEVVLALDRIEVSV